VERNKEGDDFARLRWEETKEGDTVGGARLTIEIGAEFPIGITRPVPLTASTESRIFSPARHDYMDGGAMRFQAL
jgi:hypothetical protein